MLKIFWVEDQFHWIDKFKYILEDTEFGSHGGDQFEEKNTKNSLSIYKFAESASQAIRRNKDMPDIVILDANMNGDNDAGLSISKLINQTWPMVPIIFLSEHSGTSTEEKIFEQSQTTDFIAKHQENIEKVLCWRIKALIRKSRAIDASLQVNKSVDGPLIDNSRSDKDKYIRSSDLVIDLESWTVYWHGEKLMNPNNSDRPLAPTPRKILRYLVEASPRPLTTGQMEDKLGLDRFNYASYRQHIKTLRHSFEKACQRKKLSSFMAQNQSGQGIVTFGDEGAYCWKI
ncbi:MAG: response regulator [Kangiellaceae bacterium]|nr:response regulator [Kangiellaceae bacterium]